MTLVQWLLTEMVGGALAGKALFFGALWLAAFGPMVVLRGRPWAVQLLAGLLGALNPWTAERLSEGQYGVAAAGGALFLVVAAVELRRDRPRPRPALGLAAAGAAATALNAAFFPIVVVLVACSFVGRRDWRRPEVGRWTGVAGAVFLALLAYGVVAFFAGGDLGSYAVLQHVDRAQLTFFRASASTRYGLLPNLAGLYGSSAERLGRFVIPNHGAWWWPATTAVLIGLALLGARRRPDRAWLLLAGAVGLLMSASTATSAGLHAATWLVAHFPVAGALREPEKWSALWLVALAILAAEGAAARPGAQPAAQPAPRPGEGPGARPADRGRSWSVPLATLMVLAVLLPAGVADVRTLAHQLGPDTYPADWYRAAAYLDAHVAPRSPVVVLPWHLYETLDLADGRVVANPARDFFGGHLLYPDDPEIPGEPIPAGSGGGLGPLLRSRQDAPCALATALRGRGIHWVVVEPAPGSDYDLSRLGSCGFVEVEGEGIHLTVLHDEV